MLKNLLQLFGAGQAHDDTARQGPSRAPLGAPGLAAASAGGTPVHLGAPRSGKAPSIEPSGMHRRAHSDTAAVGHDFERRSVAQTWAERRPLTVAQRRRWAQRPPSFTELLPWHLYSPRSKVFEMEDGQTLGLMFELTPVPSEAQSEDYLSDRCHRVREALQALPESETSPWIVQFFVNDDRNIEHLKRTYERYIQQVHAADPKRGQAIADSEYTREYIEDLGKHLQRVSQPDGLFNDSQVTGQIWRGQLRRVHCFIYKRFPNLVREPAVPLEQMNGVATTLMATLSEAGVGVRRCNGQDFYEWMLPFFNRNGSPQDLLATAPYPGDLSPTGTAPLMGWDMAEHLSLSEPKSSPEGGYWQFDGALVKAVALQSLRAAPAIGHFTAELQSGKERFARFDRLPPNSMLSITVVVQPQHQIERHIQRVRDASRARTATAEETHAECEAVQQQIVRGDKLYPTAVTLYLSGTSREDLAGVITSVNSQLTPSGLRLIDPADDLVPLDTFIRSLPFCWDPIFDQRDLRRSKLIFASHIAAMLPLYGRSRGTPHPGLWFWNRGGEPVWIDPLNKRDRKKNAHLLLLGPTGAGKSATAIYMVKQAMAVHRPRLVIADAGNSFGLTVEYFRAKGLSTHILSLDQNADASLPPFAAAYKLLDDRELLASFNAVGVSTDLSDLAAHAAIDPAADAFAKNHKPALDPSDEDDAADDKRDYLGEMVLSAAMMITGGETKEIERMTRADRFLVSVAIIRATIAAKRESLPHPLVHDVARELIAMSREDSAAEGSRVRLEEMGHAMMSFTQGLRGKLFNRYGQDWPDVDVTLVELGALTGDRNRDALAIAYSSLIDSVQARAERAQYEDRPMIVLTDEGHLITTNELLGPKIAMATKMWRKLNTWFWLATQNLADFPDSMSRVLSMCEWWLLLTMDPSEVEEVARFRSLTEEQRQLVLSAKKEPPKYTEGVILSAIGQMLFRNVPPPLPIALAMTEGHEKAARRRLMEQHGCDELQAARLVADQLARKRA